MQIAEGSHFKGDILFPGQFKKKVKELFLLSSDSTFQNEEGTEEVEELAEQLLFPTSIEPPSTATDLGAIHLTGDKLHLEAGTYKASDIFMVPTGSTISILSTNGPVNLYVTGKVRQVGGKLYGQPAGYHTPLNQYSPKDLRIFMTDDEDLRFSQGLSAAVVYAPKSKVKIGRHHVFLGSIMAKEAEVGESVLGARSHLYYDEALLNKSFTVNTTTPEVVLLSYQQARSTTPLTSGTVAWCAVTTTASGSSTTTAAHPAATTTP